MGRQTKVDIDSGNEAWDVDVDDNFENLMSNKPCLVPLHDGDETDLETDFPASDYEEQWIWVDHTVIGRTLYYSDGSDWIPYGEQHRPKTAISSTTTQDAADKFVLVTGTGTIDYDFLAAANWAGRTVTVRNDMSSGTLNLDPNGSENINGVSGGPLVLPIGDTAMVYCDGTELFAAIAAG